MTDSVQHELARLRRRIVAALFCEHAVRAALVLAVAASVTILVARLFGAYWPLEPRWLAVLGGIACVYGAAVAWRRAWNVQALAAHLDRRHGLGGLLITKLECDAAPWDEALEERLRASRASLPTFAPRRWLWRAAAAALFTTAIAMLPPLPLPRDRSLVAGEVARVERDVELALAAGSLDESTANDLRDRAEELKRMLEEGSDVGWNDADSLRERLAHEEGLRVDELQAARAQLDAATDPGAGDPAREEAQQELAAALARAAAAVPLPELPPALQEVLKALQAAAAAGDADAAAALQQLDAEQMKQLAEALRAGLDAKLGQLEQLGKLPADQLGDLDALLAGEAGKGRVAGAAPTDMPGNGGITRGRGDATLLMTNDSPTDTAKLAAQKLPPGIAAPREWTVVGVRRNAPEVEPEAAGPSTGAAADGPGQVTWRRRLAPKHRDAVRTFFSSRGLDAPR